MTNEAQSPPLPVSGFLSERETLFTVPLLEPFHLTGDASYSAWDLIHAKTHAAA